jgi:hypothetical protein
MIPMLARTLLLLAFASGAVFAQRYDGPRPPMPDIPYLKHADNLLVTEAVDARQEAHKDDTVYTIDGAASSARTPLAEPIFLFVSAKVDPEKLQLYKLESKNGHREILFHRKRPANPIRVEVSRLGPDNLYKLEVEEELAPGEYSLSPEGSNRAFCFQVY